MSRGRPTLTDNSRAISAPSAQTPHPLVDVTPIPGLTGHHRAHDRVLRLLKMLGCVLSGRGVATADMATRSAFPQSYPMRFFNEALLTGVRCFCSWEVG